MDAMKDALLRKRSNGLNIQLLIDGHEPIQITSKEVGDEAPAAAADAEEGMEVAAASPAAAEDQSKKLDLAPKGAGVKPVSEEPNMDDMKMVQEALGSSGKNSMNGKVSSKWSDKFNAMKK